MLKLKQLIRRLNITAHFWLLKNEKTRGAFYIKHIRPWTGEDFTITKIYL
jgi:hypothetical protein